MTNVNCEYCGHQLDSTESAAKCPHCGCDLNATDASPSNLDATLEVVEDKTAQVEPMPGHTFDKTLPLNEPAQKFDRTAVANEARFANAPEYSMTLKTSSSATDSIDLSSAIPSRSVSETADSVGLSDYRLITELGSGSFGQVFRAEQVPLERNVALKLLKERIAPSDSDDSKKDSDKRRIEAKNEFLREAKFTGKLEHPNIISIHDIGLMEDKTGKTNRPFYVMKEIRGNAWNKTIATRSRHENLEVFNRLLDAIAFAHSKNILHCDIKPENVMLGEFGEVLVVDWGQAIEVGKTETYRPGGSPAYVSPEMAEYWCDIHLDGKTISKAISKVGVRSDVYLLGAVLFEIVVGKPPHYGSPGESATDVMRHAIQNQIRPYEHLQEDELLQIALTALRVNPAASYETVEQLQQAILLYEARRNSIEIRERADSQLEQAQIDSNYDGFQKARFGFEESLELWPENEAANSGLEKTRRELAARALADENYDLGLQVLEQPKNDAEVTLRKNLESGKRKQNGRKQLVRLLSLAIVLVALVMVSREIVISGQLAEKQEKINDADIKIAAKQKELDGADDRIAAANDRADDAVANADAMTAAANDRADRAVADAEAKIADAEAKIADANAKSEDAEAKIADADVKLATANAKIADADEKIADADKRIGAAQRLQAKAAEESKIATQAIERTQFLKVKDQVSRIRQTVREGDLLSARNQLAGSSFDAQAWESSRLSLLAHPEVLAVTPEQPLLAINAAADGSQVVMVFPNKIEIRDGNDLSLIRAIENIDGTPAKAALSQDGKILAVGFQAQGGLPTQIRLYDLEGDLTNPTVLTAQAEMTDLQISGNGKHLVAVGRPSTLAKATGATEKEMMVWKSENGIWLPTPVQLAVQVGGSNEGALPQFTAARLSQDGVRILTTNPDAKQPTDQKAHVFEYGEEGYQWIGETPSGINIAEFADPSGNRLIGCATNAAQQVFSLVQWDLEEPSQITDRKTSDTRLASFATQPNNDNFKVLTPLDSQATTISITDGWVVVGLGNKDTQTWKLTPEGLVETADLGGRSQPADFVSAVPVTSDGQPNLRVLSASTGSNAEIRLTDLRNYRDEVRAARLDSGTKESTTIIGVPYRHQYSVTDRGLQTAVGTDKGWVMVREPNGSQVQWEVSAWREHLLTEPFLFARSNRDNLFRYDRTSGVLQDVITGIASSQAGGAVDKIEISKDGRIAVVSRRADAPEFEVWDLNSQNLIRKIRYGDKADKMTQFAVSDDGKWVIGVKIVGFQVWSVETGAELPTDFSKNSVNGGPPIDWPNVPLNTVRFLPDSAAFITSWKNRIHVYDINNGQVSNPRKYLMNKSDGQGLIYEFNSRNVLDARRSGEVVLILARSSDRDADNPKAFSGVRLFELTAVADPQNAGYSAVNPRSDGDAADARFATFSGHNSEEFIYLINGENDRVRFRNWKNKSNREISGLSGIPGVLVKVFEDLSGNLTLQSTQPNPNDPSRRNWNTRVLNADRSAGPLRVEAQPAIEFVNANGSRVVTLASQVVQFWEIKDGFVSSRGRLPGFWAQCSLSPDGDVMLVQPAGSNEIQVVNTATMKPASKLLLPEGTGSISSIAWSQDGSHLAMATDSQILLWRVPADRSAVWPQPSQTLEVGGTQSVAFSDAAWSLLAVNADGTASVYRVDGEGTDQSADWSKPIRSLNLVHVDGQRIVAADISADGKRVISGADNGRLTLWNTLFTDQPTEGSQAAGERELMTLMNRRKAHRSPVTTVEFVPVGDSENRHYEVVTLEANPEKSEYLIWETNPVSAARQQTD